MTPVPHHRLAIGVMRLARRLLPPHIRHWGDAAQNELESIESRRDALWFALGSLRFAVCQAIDFHTPRLPQAANILSGETGSMNNESGSSRHPRRMIALCAVGATILGVTYMRLAGAPASYLAMNIGALIVGFATVGVAALVARSGRVNRGAVALTFAMILLLTGILGTAVDSATRWVAWGPLFIQPSLFLLPLMAIWFARTRDGLSAIAIGVAALALAIQPDRAMSGALLAAMAALAVVKPERNVLMALTAAIAGFAVTLFRPDTLPAAPYVDQIFYSSFDVHPAAGAAVLGGAILMIVPAVVGSLYDGERREAYAVFGAIWFAILAAAALGNYPTPVVGYGGSAIIGYVLSMVGMPARAGTRGVQALPGTSDSPETGSGQNLRAGLSLSS